jgi:aconitate hydratase
VFEAVDSSFYQKALAQKVGFVVGGENYGQGSSREHAAIAPRYLGIRAKFVKSFARIHKANLINFGILPLTFANLADYDELMQDQRILLRGIIDALKSGKDELIAKNESTGKEFILKMDLTERDREILLAGGLINTASK